MSYIIDDVDLSNDACEAPLRRMIARGLDGRIHCVYRNHPDWKATSHISYAYSDNYGLTWAKEDPVEGNPTSALYNPCIVVDSNNIPHIIYRDLGGVPTNAIKYIHRTTGTWSSPATISRGFEGQISVGAGFIVGETVRGATSGAEAECLYFDSLGGTPPQGALGVESPHVGFLSNEQIVGQTSGKQLKYEDDVDDSYSSPSLAIDSNDMLHIAVGRYHLQKPYGGNWSHGNRHDIFTGGADAIDVDSDGLVHIISNKLAEYKYAQGNFNSWSAPVSICTGATNWGNFSMAVDLSGNVHLALQQTDLGGTNDGVLNIHYYKRTDAWGSVEHITDDTDPRKDPTIAVDKNDNIRVAFRGIGYGDNAANEDLVMRLKPSGGSWGAVQELTDRIPAQYVPQMLHALFPVSVAIRPGIPDGYALIWNGQNGSDTYTVEYYSEIIEAFKAFPQMTLI